jgi:hypothetical protein
MALHHSTRNQNSIQIILQDLLETFQAVWDTMPCQQLTFHRITVPSSSKPSNPHREEPEDEVTTILLQGPHKLPGDITEGLNCS